jgi:N-acetylneuraminic acid mutarotase
MSYARLAGLAMLTLVGLFSSNVGAVEAIEFETPRGGEVFYSGQSQTVRVRSRYKTLTIELSRDGGATYEVLGNTTRVAGPRSALTFTVGGGTSYNAILRATAATPKQPISATSPVFSMIGGDAGNAEPKRAAGFYTRANISVDEGGQIIGIASSGPVNLGTEVSGALGNANLGAQAVTNDKIAPATISADKINSNPASDGFVLSADGTGGAKWVPIKSGGGAPGGTAGGDLSGLYPDPSIALNAVTAEKIAAGAVDLATKVSGVLPDANLSANVPLATGRAGGQTISGGTQASENLVLQSTQNATSGFVLLAPGGGNVGIGTNAPAQRLSVAGTVESTTGGFRFPDGTTQATAATGGVPSGYSILGDSATPPPNFSYSGNSLILGGSEQWTGRANMPSGAASSGVGVINGKVYVVGGTNGPMMNTCQEYDPSANSWQVRAPMPTPRDWLGCTVYNNRLYTFGGYNGTTMLNVTEMYDPSTNTWTTLAPMPTARSGQSAAVVNGKIYVIGGDLAGVSELTTNEEYDPATNTWAARAPMPTARTAGGVGVVNNRIYYMGGSTADNGTLFNRNEMYDPATNSWTVMAPLSFARHNVAAATLNGRIYIIGGSTLNSALSNNDEYNPSTNTWTAKAGMPGPRQYINAGVANGRIYVFGGYDGSYSNTTTEYTITGATYYVHRRN